MNERILKIKPRKALNKAFLKVKPVRSDIENFKNNLSQLLKRINDNESEEFHKNLVSDFLKDTYYKQKFFINTKGRNDLVIHNGEKAANTVGVIIEAKKPTNKAEMLKAFAPEDTKEQMLLKINVKAFQELVLYYLRERITEKNIEVKHLIATNIYEWYIFDAAMFDRLFAQNKNLVKQFNDFEAGRLADVRTDFFYKQIAEPFINEIEQDIEFTYFDIRDYEKPLLNEDKSDDNKLIALFKLLSPEHLLKLPFANDSNSLDKRFYSELLHIIGLNETKEGSKKIIERNKEGLRNTGSFIENAIIQLESLDKISRLENARHFGETLQERLFNVSMELCITWINRILFLKLMEAQLVTYHKGDKSYEFLNFKNINDYDELNSLFFQVLARQHDERNQDVKQKFAKVPYLNSSLFEPSEIEHKTLFISQLSDDKKIPYYSQTVLKDEQGKKLCGEANPLEYLFEFLNAYDFASEGSEDIQEENKTLINASVLGLIFEKINGYKDGSFFTPGFITMYMCRETIRKAVIQKFNEAKGWSCEDINSIYNKIEDRNQANEIINSIKICDPAVGSGHFLVSALNEIIAVKSDLKILQDKQGRRLKEYNFEVVNDELIITDEDGELFEYNYANKESQRIQEALFHEKQTIIENCLFGVDINPNSVKICRLRLWIELLKNAYYKNETELETLPNIDINIKCGNSLISRFALDADLKQALIKSKYNIESYRIAVDTYRNAENKEQKREMERLINIIKNDFRSEISQNDPKVKRLRNLNGELFTLTNQGQLFELTQKEKAEWNKKVEKLTTDIKNLETEIEEIKSNKIFENAFEWRFEFPEVLDDNGEFVGFDVVIGNPPYIDSETMVNSGMGEIRDYLTKKNNFAKGNWDIYIPFYETSFSLLNKFGFITFITPDKWISKPFGYELRKGFIKNLFEICEAGREVFESALVDSIITIYSKQISNNIIVKKINNFDFISLSIINDYKVFEKNEYSLDWLFSPYINLLKKIEDKKLIISDIGTCENACATSDAYKLVNYIINIDNDIDFNNEIHLKIINTGTIDKYRNKWGTKEMTYLKSKYLKPIVLKSSFLKDFENSYSKKSIIPKLIIKGLTLLDASLDNDGTIIPGKSTLILTAENTKFLYYCLGLINSKLMYFYIKEKYRGSSYNQGIGFTKKMINNFPIPEFNDELYILVVQIIENISNKLDFDITEIQSQIDQLVYQLYELTEEEIKIIEGGVK